MRFANLLLTVVCSPLLVHSAAAQERLSGPFSYQNLTVFVVKGERRAAARPLKTLAQAIAERKVVVKETQNVNSLRVENLGAQEVFLQAGDLVRGGQQDRMISKDTVLPARRGEVAVEVFCVEQGRWTQRGQESVQQFERAENLAPLKVLKAARVLFDQASVWRAVGEVQGDLIRSLGSQAKVKSDASSTSLPLSMTGAEVSAAADRYTKALKGAIDGQADAVGLVAAINGEVVRADVYSSGAMFHEMLPKLLQSSALDAVEAGAARGKTVGQAQAAAFLQRGGKAPKVEAGNGVTLAQYAEEKKTMVESRGRSGWIHRSYVKQ